MVFIKTSIKKQNEGACTTACPDQDTRKNGNYRFARFLTSSFILIKNIKDSTTHKGQIILRKWGVNRTKVNLLSVGNVTDEIHNTVAVAPFVVIPSHDLHKVVVQSNSSLGIKNA